MSSKVNIFGIVKGHIATLSDPAGKISWMDIVTFFAMPGVAAIIGVMAGYNLNKDVASMLVNFGAIFTALLLSVLVLVYDQENKLRSSSDRDLFYGKKCELLGQLYFNICFSIISSLVLIALCLGHTVLDGVVHKLAFREVCYPIDYARYIVTPLIVFVVANLMLTILMVVKRIHAILTFKN